MSRILFMSIVLAAGACGGQSRAPAAQELGTPSADRFAPKELCERAVDNLEKNEQLSTTTPVGKKGFFNRVEFDERHRDRVRRCTISLTEKEAVCIADAPSLQYVRECRKFALVK